MQTKQNPKQTKKTNKKIKRNPKQKVMHILKINFIKNVLTGKLNLHLCNMQIIGTRLEAKQIYNIHRSQYSLSEALELLGCSDLSPDPPGLLLPLSQAEKRVKK